MHLMAHAIFTVILENGNGTDKESCVTVKLEICGRESGGGMTFRGLWKNVKKDGIKKAKSSSFEVGRAQLEGVNMN